MAGDPMHEIIAGRAAGPAKGAASADRTREASVEFEAVFLSQMLQGMAQGLGPDSLFGREPFGSMLVDQCARMLARSGGIGLAGTVQQELLRLQEIGA